MSSLSHPKYQRQRIVKYAQKHSVTETAIRYKVSRKTVYKWLSRYDGSIASLEDRSHRPKTSPKSHTEQELRQIRRLKKYKWMDLLLAYQELIEKDGYTRAYGGFKRVVSRLKALKPEKRKAETQTEAISTSGLSGTEDTDRCEICTVLLCGRRKEILSVYSGRRV